MRGPWRASEGSAEHPGAGGEGRVRRLVPHRRAGRRPRRRRGEQARVSGGQGALPDDGLDLQPAILAQGDRIPHLHHPFFNDDMGEARVVDLQGRRRRWHLGGRACSASPGRPAGTRCCSPQGGSRATRCSPSPRRGGRASCTRALRISGWRTSLRMEPCSRRRSSSAASSFSLPRGERSSPRSPGETGQLRGPGLERGQHPLLRERSRGPGEGRDAHPAGVDAVPAVGPERCANPRAGSPQDLSPDGRSALVAAQDRRTLTTLPIGPDRADRCRRTGWRSVLHGGFGMECACSRPAGPRRTPTTGSSSFGWLRPDASTCP